MSILTIKQIIQATFLSIELNIHINLYFVWLCPCKLAPFTLLKTNVHLFNKISVFNLIS